MNLIPWLPHRQQDDDAPVLDRSLPLDRPPGRVRLLTAPRLCPFTGQSGQVAQGRDQVGIVSQNVRDRQDAGDGPVLSDRQVADGLFLHQ